MYSNIFYLRKYNLKIKNKNSPFIKSRIYFYIAKGADYYQNVFTLVTLAKHEFF